MKLRFIVLFSLLFGFMLFTSCSYAFTWEDYIDFCHNIGNTDVTYTDTIWIANRIYNNRTTIQNIVESANYRFEDYNNYFAFKERGSNTNYLLIYKNQMGIEWNKRVSGVTYSTYITNASINTNSTNGIAINLNNLTRYTSSGTLFYGQEPAVGLVEYMTNTGNSYKYMWDKYIRAKILRTNLDGLTSPYQFAEATVGYNIYNGNHNWYILQIINGSNIYTQLDKIVDDQGDYINYDLELTDSMLENIDQEENCFLIYGTNTITKYQSQAFNLDFSTGPGTSGGMTNASGEIIFNIDLQGIENRLDNIDGTIKSGDTAILEQLKQNESGNDARFNYWVGFFSPSGDNISNNIINNSGDIFGITYENIDNYGIFHFVYDFFESLNNILFDFDTDVTLDMGIFGEIDSAYFVINNSSINTFLSIVLNSTLILITIFFYFRFIKQVSTLNLKFIDNYDIDNNIRLF